MFEDETLQRSSLMADQQDRPDEKPDVPPSAPPPPAPESASPPPAAPSPAAPAPAAPAARRAFARRATARRAFAPSGAEEDTGQEGREEDPREGRQEGCACQESCQEGCREEGAAENHVEAGRHQRRSQHSRCSQRDCGESQIDGRRGGQSHDGPGHGAAGGARAVAYPDRCGDRGGHPRHPVGDRGASTRRRLTNHLTLT